MLLTIVNSPDGGGKTHSLVRIAAELAGNDTYVLFVQPTVDLISQTAADMTKRHPGLFIETIHRDNSPTPVRNITRYLFQPYPDGHVLFITQAAFERIKADFKKSKWHLIVDEIPNITRCFDQNLAENHTIITPYLGTSPDPNTPYDLLSVKDFEQLEAIADNENDDAVWANFKDLANILLSPRWESYVDRKAYDNLINGGGSKSKLTVFSVLKPNIFQGFRSVTLAGACFKDSLLYLYWSKLGIEFVEAANHNLRYEQHENGDELTILWAVEQNWSKCLLNKKDGQVLKMMEEAVLKEFGGAEFLYAQNKGHNLFKGIGKPLPNAPHKLNDFQDIPNVAFLSARNLTPAHCKFLQRMIALTEDEIRTAIHRHVAYQTVMRGALRDPKNHEEKRVFVPDLGTAEWLQSLFPGAKLRKLETDFEKLGLALKRGRTKVYNSATERKGASRERLKVKEKRIKEFNDLRTLAVPTEHELQSIKIHQDGHDMSIYTNTNFVTGFTKEFRGSLLDNKRSEKPFNCYVTKTIEDFEQELKEASSEKYDKKEDNFLICPSAFDPDKAPGKKRGKANVVFASGIWLDFDGGDLKPPKLSKIFSTLRMTVFSSFSSTKEILRFRVYTPTDNVMSAQQYEAITKELVKTITAAGFYKEKSKGQSNRHGLDMSKLHAVSPFYLPCQPKDPSGRYFKVFKGMGREPLNVQEWIEKYIAEEEVNTFVEANTFIETPIDETQFGSQETYSFDQDAVERACSEWHQCPPGSGNHEFFKLGLKLAGVGCDQSEIVSILKEQAHYARSPDERLNQIPSNIDVLASLQ